MSMMPEIRAKIEQRLKEIEAEREQLMQMLSLANEEVIKKDQPKLAESIKAVLANAPPLQLRDIFIKLKEAGYTFRGQNPKMSVYSAMARHPEVFQKMPKGEGWTLSNGIAKKS